MKNIFYSLILIALAASAATSAEPSKGEAEKPEQAERRSRASEPQYDLNFPSGTLADLIKALEKASGQKPNVFIPTEALKLTIPKLELRSVTTANVMDSLAFFLMDEYGHALRRNGVTWVLTTRPDRRKAQAFYVGNLLSKFKIQDITTAIETTWRPSPKGSAPEIKFHEDTQLLIVFADSSLIEVVTNVLSQLQQAMVTKGDAQSDTKTSPKG